jgi:hypothetical protein
MPITDHKQVYAVGHRHEFGRSARPFSARTCVDDLCETLVDGSFDDRAAMLRASQHVVAAVVDDVRCSDLVWSISP